MRTTVFHIATIILCFCVGLTTLSAQNQKIGYVNTDEILPKLPEYEGISQRLNVISQNWQQQINEMEQQIAELKKEFEAKEILFTDEIRKQRKLEIEELERKKKTFIQSKYGPEGEYFQRQKELLEPIQRVVFDAITAVAEQNGFDFVFDRAGDVSVMYTRQEWNLNDEVLMELGIDIQNSRN